MKRTAALLLALILMLSAFAQASGDIDIVRLYSDPPTYLVETANSWNLVDEKGQLLRQNYVDSFYELKPGLYLVGCMEKNMACRGMTGNSMLFVIDTKRVHDVGRSFGHAGLETGHVRPENYIYGAFGEFVKSDGVLESMPNIYREKQVW